MSENQPEVQPTGKSSPFAADAEPADAEPDGSGDALGSPDRGPRRAAVVDRAEVERVIQVIRPAIQADNGDIVLVDVDETSGVITVELIGACVSCPASTVTLKAGIERILKDRVPGVTEVIDAGQANSVLTETSVSL